MGQSIFEMENRLNIQNEFEKFIKVFHKMEAVEIEEIRMRRDISLFEYFDINTFINWEYRDTMLTTSDFLKHIGITYDIIEQKNKINKENFLMYIEFVLNMLDKCKEESENVIMQPILVATIKNISIILEKMNYESRKTGDKIILAKRDADVDSIIEEVPKEISLLLLEYNDFRVKNDINEKKRILKQIDLYIEKNINIKSFDKGLSDTIGTIVNEMGVNHPIKKIYSDFDSTQLIEWYDKCFLLMIHAIRSIEVNEIKNERKELVKS